MNTFCDIKEGIWLLYLSKQLQEIDKIDAIKSYLNEEIDSDMLYELLYDVINNIFEYSENRYYDKYELELMVLSDQIVMEFYQMAAEYGRRKNFVESANPYFIAAENELQVYFSYSYSLEWKMYAHPHSKRPFYSRFAIFIYHDDYVDLFGIAIGIAGMYRFFLEKCRELNNLLFGQGVLTA